MKKLLLLALLASWCLEGATSDGACQKCIRIREANARKAKDQNWEYYEDWEQLKEEGKVIEFDGEDGDRQDS